MGIADRNRASDRQPGAVEGPGVGGILEGLPALAEFMVQDTWADGSCRELPTILIFASDGIWKCCVNDRAEERSGWASGHSVDDCLATLDSALATGTVEWRRSFGSKRRKS